MNPHHRLERARLAYQRLNDAVTNLVRLGHPPDRVRPLLEAREKARLELLEAGAGASMDLMVKAPTRGRKAKIGR